MWHKAVMTDLKPILKTIANIAAVILALIYPNGEFIPPYKIEPGMFVLYFPVCQA